jgi:hypothetical protein
VCHRCTGRNWNIPSGKTTYITSIYFMYSVFILWFFGNWAYSLNLDRPTQFYKLVRSVIIWKPLIARNFNTGKWHLWQMKGFPIRFVDKNWRHLYWKVYESKKSAFQGYKVVCNCNFLPTLRDNISVPSSRVTIINYHYSLLNSQEDSVLITRRRKIQITPRMWICSPNLSCLRFSFL